LDQRRSALRALTDALAKIEPGSDVSSVVPAAIGLPPVGACADVEALRAVSPLPAAPETRARIAGLREQLEEARSAKALGRYEEALAKAREVLAGARDVDYPPLLAEALFEQAKLLEFTGDYEAARAGFLDTAVAAAR